MRLCKQASNASAWHDLKAKPPNPGAASAQDQGPSNSAHQYPSEISTSKVCLAYLGEDLHASTARILQWNKVCGHPQASCLVAEGLVFQCPLASTAGHEAHGTPE
eukprot:5462577-Karenia_brevis.AAC.1